MAAAVAAPALATTHHKGTEISTHKTSLGRVLSNEKGRVMYIFLKDGHKVSHCTGVCASVWPKVMSKSAKPRARDGVKAKHLSRTSKGQVTYYGHPLYYFASAKKAGKITGEGLNHFFVVSTHGKPIKPKKKAAPGATGPAEVTTGTVGASSTEVITNKNGRTLYALSPNEPPFECGAGCTSTWRPLLTKGKPTAAGDAMATKLGTVKRSGLGTQVTYNGAPVYTYKIDTTAGQDNGQAVTGPGGIYNPDTWYDLAPDGSFNMLA